MSASATQASRFLANISKVATMRGTKTGHALVPVNESPPTMWTTDIAWFPFDEAHEMTSGGFIRHSDDYTDGKAQIRHVRTCLTSLMVLIAAKTAEHRPGLAISAKTTRQWCSFIATYSRAVFVQAVERVGVGAIECQPSIDAVTALVDWYDELIVFAMAVPEGLSAQLMFAKTSSVASMFDLPSVGAFNVQEAHVASHRDLDKEDAAYYALIVYMAGRSLTNRTSNAVSVTRPANLQQKFNEGAEWGSIGGLIKMSAGAYSMIAKAWQMNTTMRIALLSPLIGLETGESYVTGNIVYTMFKLLRGAGMAHVGIIAEFLRRYPYAAEMSELRNEIYYLGYHSEALCSYTPREQPYFKLLHADATPLFDSKTLSRLTGLAVTILSETNPTLADYAHTADAALEQAFRDLRATIDV